MNDAELVTLEQACRLRDAAAELQAAIDQDGVMTKSTRGTPRVHPAFVDLRATRLAVSTLIRALKLPDDVAADAAIAKSVAARSAARARWDGSRGRPGHTRRST